MFSKETQLVARRKNQNRYVLDPHQRSRPYLLMYTRYKRRQLSPLNRIKSSENGEKRLISIVVFSACTGFCKTCSIDALSVESCSVCINKYVGKTLPSCDCEYTHALVSYQMVECFSFVYIVAIFSFVSNSRLL